MPASPPAALPPVGHRRRVAGLHDQGRDGPRRWNPWLLERAARVRPAASPTEADERSFLLLYLRRFAAPDGLLPVECDGLVRRSFSSPIGELEEA